MVTRVVLSAVEWPPTNVAHTPQSTTHPRGVQRCCKGVQHMPEEYNTAAEEYIQHCFKRVQHMLQRSTTLLQKSTSLPQRSTTLLHTQARSPPKYCAGVKHCWPCCCTSQNYCGREFMFHTFSFIWSKVWTVWKQFLLAIPFYLPNC